MFIDVVIEQLFLTNFYTKIYTHFTKITLQFSHEITKIMTLLFLFLVSIIKQDILENLENNYETCLANRPEPAKIKVLNDLRQLKYLIVSIHIYSMDSITNSMYLVLIYSYSK